MKGPKMHKVKGTRQGGAKAKKGTLPSGRVSPKGKFNARKYNAMHKSVFGTGTHGSKVY